MAPRIGTETLKPLLPSCLYSAIGKPTVMLPIRRQKLFLQGCAASELPPNNDVGSCAFDVSGLLQKMDRIGDVIYWDVLYFISLVKHCSWRVDKETFKRLPSLRYHLTLDNPHSKILVLTIAQRRDHHTRSFK